MSASPAAVRGLVDLFVAPKDALQAAYDHPRRLWLPLGIIIFSMLAFWIWYYQTVDFDWLVDHFLSMREPRGVRMSTQEMTPEQVESARRFMSPTSMIVQTIIGVTVITLLVYAIVALYLNIVAKVGGNTETEYGRWFSLVVWTSLPTIVIVVGMALNYAMAENGRIAPENLAVTNLANLLGLDMSKPGWERTLGSFDIVMLWQIFLLGLGVSMYSKKSLAAGIVIAAIPTVLFYSISLLIAVL